MLILLVGCGAKADVPAGQFTTERLNHGMLRLENDEVICYRWDEGGLSCQMK